MDAKATASGLGSRTTATAPATTTKPNAAHPANVTAALAVSAPALAGASRTTGVLPSTTDFTGRPAITGAAASDTTPTRKSAK